MKAEHIRYFGDSFNLRDDRHVQAVVDVLKAGGIGPRLIVLDTLARLMVGADENNAKDMGEAIYGIDKLRSDSEATVLVIHHTGKKGGTERGSSALRGAADVMIECKGVIPLVQLRCDKMKDAAPFKPIQLGLETISLGQNASSLAVTRSSVVALESAAQQGAAKRALEILKQIGPAGATFKEWLDAFEAATGQKKSTFDRALRTLKERNAVRQQAGRYYAIGGDGGVSINPVSK